MESALQKRIQNQSRVHSSLYTMNISSLNNKINKNNEGIKHSSYERYLLRKKGNILSSQNKKISTTPVSGNKTQSLPISSYVSDNCLHC